MSLHRPVQKFLTESNHPSRGAGRRKFSIFFKNGIKKRRRSDSSFVTESIWPRSLFLLFFISRLSSLLRLVPTYGNGIVSTPWLQSPEREELENCSLVFYSFSLDTNRRYGSLFFKHFFLRSSRFLCASAFDSFSRRGGGVSYMRQNEILPFRILPAVNRETPSFAIFHSIFSPVCSDGSHTIPVWNVGILGQS